MQNPNQQNSVPVEPKVKMSTAHRRTDHKDEVRFWQTVSLSLAILALSILASLVITLITTLLVR
jgi:hypothetical protein